MLAAAIGLTLASAAAVNWGYVREQRAAAALPPLSIRRPLESVARLLSHRSWLIGFATETAGFLCFVGALALAPLALVQSLAAGGIAILAFLTARLSGMRLRPRERLGVVVAVVGLVLLGVSLTGGSGEGSGGRWIAIAIWALASGIAATVGIRLGVRLIGAGASYGLAAGILFAAGDVTTKTVVTGGARLAFLPVLFAMYGLGTSVLQVGFQKGGALATAGTATLFTDELPIVAGTTLYAEPFPGGLLGLLRTVGFVALVLGAVALSRADTMLKPGCPQQVSVKMRDGKRRRERASEFKRLSKAQSKFRSPSRHRRGRRDASNQGWVDQDRRRASKLAIASPVERRAERSRAGD